MNATKKFTAAATFTLLSALPATPQAVTAPEIMRRDVTDRLEEARGKIAQAERMIPLDLEPMLADTMASLQERMPELQARIAAEINPAIAGLARALALLQGSAIDRSDRVRSEIRDRVRSEIRNDSNDHLYESGSRALDSNRWEDAVRRFSDVAAHKGARADGALYWKAYAENRLGRKDDALASIAALRKEYPRSSWLNDAQALEVEVRQQTGKPVAADAESNEDLKLIALNSLMHNDPDQAVPMVEKILRGANSPRVKERALFVLTQSGSPRAKQVLLSTAKGGTNPDLQLKAIRYVGMLNSADAKQELAAAYKSSNDVTVKRAILRSYVQTGSKDTLLDVAKTESNPELRGEAIRLLGALGSSTEVGQLYATESSAENKQAIMRAMMQTNNSDRLLELARTEKDPKLRAAAVHYLGGMKSAQVADGLPALYQNDTDPATRKAILHALVAQQNAKALVDIARKEKDPEIKREIVENLSHMRSKESTDYLMELLNK